jgi:ABC-type proline/glycine betaine transport system ATPase subunit
MNAMDTRVDLAIAMRGVTKIFGEKPAEALALLQSGKSKAEVQAETNHVVGLDNVSLDIARGQIFVVMGLSGSGKSTLIRHVNRLIEPTAGEIVVNGADVTKMSLDELRTFRRTQIAMVFQKFGLLPPMVWKSAGSARMNGSGKRPSGSRSWACRVMSRASRDSFPAVSSNASAWRGPSRWTPISS